MASHNPATADYLVDRNRLRRKLSFWRVLAFLAVLLAIGIGGYRLAGGSAGFAGDHIARVTVSGLITGDRESLRLLERVRDSSAKAVILSISSPGGTTAGAEMLHEGIRRLAEKKPVVAVVNNMAASGAYIAAISADRIFAQQNSLIGSIGVLVQIPNVSGLLNTVGVKVETIKSAPLKASPNGLEPTSPEARAAMSAIVMDSYDWFKGLVQERRKLSNEELQAVSDGRIFTGRQSIKLKLVDELGGERAAVAWLENEKGVAKNLRIRDWRKSSSGTFGLTTAAALVSWLGFDSAAHGIELFARARDKRLLDGLVAVWQGEVVE